jgi:hypothetical protein
MKFAVKKMTCLGCKTPLADGMFHNCFIISSFRIIPK